MSTDMLWQLIQDRYLVYDEFIKQQQLNIV